MTPRICLALALTLVLAGNAAADPVLWPASEGGNGHYYEVVWGYVPIVSWLHANAFANERQYEGLGGHLVTLDAVGEFAWVMENLNLAAYPPVYTNPDPSFAIGGFRQVTACNDDQAGFPGAAEPVWVTGETWDDGLLPAISCGEPVYCSTFFGPVEPYYGLVHTTGGQWETWCNAGGSHLIIEYDGLPVVLQPNHPGGPVAEESTTWGAVKALHR